MSSSQVMLLVEGGGSHTHVFMTVGGRAAIEMTLPSLNRTGQSESHFHVIDEITSVVKEFGEIDLSYFALGAAATPMYLNRISEDFQTRWRAQALSWQGIFITNDIVPLMFTEEDQANQLIVISGTGSGIAARAGFDHVVRRGANEYLLGDEGGAFDIGCRGLRAIFQMRENRGRATVLEELANQWSKGQELNWFVYESKSSKQTIASFAPHVFEADAQGDAVAKDILDEAALDLAQICDSALLGLDRPDDIIVTFSGTLLNEPTGRLRSRLETMLRQQKKIERFELKAVDNALMQHTAEKLLSSPLFLTKISSAIPARSY